MILRADCHTHISTWTLDASSGGIPAAMPGTRQRDVRSRVLLAAMSCGVAIASTMGQGGRRRMSVVALEQKEKELHLWASKLAQREAALASSTTVANEDSTSSPDQETLVFEENFETFDLELWKHEITMGGGGNWEFQLYTNNRTNSYVSDGVLYMQPTLSADTFGKDRVMGRTPSRIDLWGGLSAADSCTSNQFYGCERQSDASIRRALNPIQSARIRTAGTFSYKYGRLEVVAKLPKGKWLWPAIWLLPEDNAYGQWPASGEIDLMESRGNAPGYAKGGYDTFSSCLHWGPFFELDAFAKTYAEHKLKQGTFADDFHTFGLAWNERGMYTYVDSDDNRLLDIDFTEMSFWERGGFDKMGLNDPWSGRPNAAPFDQPFYLVFNVAVGGLAPFFPDGEDAKPWTNKDVDAAYKFIEAQDQWYPTWKGKDSALQIKSVKVWQKGASPLPSRFIDESALPTEAPTAAASHHAAMALGFSLGVALCGIGYLIHRKATRAQYQFISV